MFTAIHPKIPMRNKRITRNFYFQTLGFEEVVPIDFDGYMMLKKDKIELHFFEFRSLDPKENYGQIYIRCSDIDRIYQKLLDQNIAIHPNGQLQKKSWGIKEFSILDPDLNLITFGEAH